jgi:hypothetical protein
VVAECILFALDAERVSLSHQLASTSATRVPKLLPKEVLVSYMIRFIEGTMNGSGIDIYLHNDAIHLIAFDILYLYNFETFCPICPLITESALNEAIAPSFAVGADSLTVR